MEHRKTSSTPGRPTIRALLSRRNQPSRVVAVGGVTYPLGHPTTMVRSSPGLRTEVVTNVGVPLASCVVVTALAVEPGAPVYALRPVIFAAAPVGSVTVADACSMGKSQPLPVTFQYSSSWSAK